MIPNASSLRRTALFGAAFALTVATCLQAPRLGKLLHPERDPRAASWADIGGCGAGGGAGSAGAGKWIGRGATGGLYDLELLANKTIGGDYVYNQIGLNASKRVLEIYTAGVSLAWKSNVFEIDPYKTASDFYGTKTQATGGFGDLGLSLSRNFGSLNQYMAGLSVSFPTGQHDIKRTFSNAEQYSPWLPPQTQPGSGHYTLGATTEYTIDRDWGLYLFGANYTASFARRVECARSQDPTTRFRECQEYANDPLTWKLWKLRHNAQDSYNGAPGTGATQGDALSVYAHAGIKEESATQSAGATLSIPMSPSYYWEKGPGGPFSLRRRTNDIVLKLSYGVEVNLDPRNFPLFFSVGLPFRLNEMLAGEEWNPGAPQNYILTAGIKGTFL